MFVSDDLEKCLSFLLGIEWFQWPRRAVVWKVLGT